jgi:hypothetical protein
MKIKIIVIVICIFFIVNTIPVSAKYNNPPNPPIITGPSIGKIGEKYVYYITVTDPDEDDHFWELEIDFGDELITEKCSGGDCKPWDNGETILIEHSWKESGSFDVKARVLDVYGAWSNWSDPLKVTMPINRNINSLFLRIIEHHSNILRIIQKFLDQKFLPNF